MREDFVSSWIPNGRTTFFNAEPQGHQMGSIGIH